MKNYNIRSDHEELKKLGFSFSGNYLENDNYIALEDQSECQLKCHINLLSGQNNSFYIGRNCVLKAEVTLSGSFNYVRVDGEIARNFMIGLCLIVQEDDNQIHLKSGVTAQDATLVVQRGTKITIGTDSMLSYGVVLRTTDSHAVIDMEKRAIINTPEDITIGEHVWVCEKVTILKGANIGSGSVIASGAVVRGATPKNALIGGIPASARGRNITWHRTQDATQEQIDEQIKAAQRY